LLPPAASPSAAKALRLNFTELLPKIMPLREMAAFGANYASRKLLGRHSVKPYKPDLQKCAKHICIHTGARKFILALPTHCAQCVSAACANCDLCASSALH
jgi:hypothetical protein